MTTTASQSPTVLLALIFVIVSFLQQQQLVLASTPPPPLTTTPSSNSSPVIPAPSVFTRISNFFHQRQQARAAIKRERRLVDYFQACNQGSVDRVSHFLYPYNPRDAPIDIDTADSTANSASTCLMKAALARQYDLISYLLLRGGNPTHS